jgi:hypothetical protein
VLRDRLRERFTGSDSAYVCDGGAACWKRICSSISSDSTNLIHGCLVSVRM